MSLILSEKRKEKAGNYSACDTHEAFLYLKRDKTIDIGKYCKTKTALIGAAG